jgi:hypothetical protein
MTNRIGGTPIPLEAAYPSYITETIPKSKRGYRTNNAFPDFPPKMSDGRSLISSWNPESVFDNAYRKEHESQFRDAAPLNANWSDPGGSASYWGRNRDFGHNWMYRRYMQKNAMEIMEGNFRETANDTGSSIPNTEVSVSKPRNAPHLFTSLTDPSRPFGFQESDLKSLYLTREQLNARKHAPVIN